MDPYAAIRVGMGIQVEQGLVALHRPVDVEQGNLLRRLGQFRPGMPRYAAQESRLAQGGHQLPYIAGVGFYALGNPVAGENHIRIQIYKTKNVDSIADLGRIFHVCSSLLTKIL